MSISEKDVKKLWGLSAGRCAFPGCGIECLVFLEEGDPTVIGEMAHVIAQSPKGPRGVEKGGDDTYENLILLCPTHHRQVDKAPEGVYPEEMLFDWKNAHEQFIRESLKAPKYPDSIQMARAIKRLLITNHQIWLEFGPESEKAQTNPLSNLYEIWNYRKLGTILPNNRKIISIIESHEEMFEIADFKVCREFIEHAIAFEQSCYSRIEGAKRFPLKFQEVIDKYAQI